ncbi:MAG: citrate/2-methylcitrate synthase [Clostridia bacterium]
MYEEKAKQNLLIDKWSQMALEANNLDTELYKRYEVKRGLRDLNGKGVLAGLTRIGEVSSYITYEGESIPAPGQLNYRGINIENLVDGFIKEKRFGFEETCFLLLVGHLPTSTELAEFKLVLADNYRLPEDFLRDIIMKAPSKDMMNLIARSVLTLYSFDEHADDISEKNVLRQSIQLIASFPLLAIYGYQVYNHYHKNKSLFIHAPQTDLSIAENILYMLRPDNQYTQLEAKLLDLALVLHAEHGGGNNSTFTAHVVTSTLTDTYSVVAAALGSLKGPRHGGANIKVVQMFEDMKMQVINWQDQAEVEAYITRIVTKQAFDKLGLVYGMGHAVYSISDPRAVIFKHYAKELAGEKGCEAEFKLYELVEHLAPVVIAKHRKIYKGVSANVDFYSGLVYSMLNIPEELYTPLFAIARIAGWCAHILEEIANDGKIIRPAYKSVEPRKDYVILEER